MIKNKSEKSGKKSFPSPENKSEHKSNMKLEYVLPY